MLNGMGIISTYRCIWCLVYNSPAFRLLLFVAKDALNICLAMERHKKNAVVLFDSVFVYLDSATTIEAVMRTLGRNSSGKRARSPKEKN